MKISEMVFTVGKSGTFRIPAKVLQEMGIGPGDHIRIAYLTKDGIQNDYQEFLLYGDIDEEMAQESKILLPSSLLEQANITAGDDIQIACLNGCLFICQDATADVDDLYSLLEQLQNANALVQSLPPDTCAALNQLDEITDSMWKGANLENE